MKTTPLGPFLGINNRLQDFALHVDKVGDFLSVALNVDIDNKGKIRRRNATELIQALSGAHSMHMTTATTGYIGIGTSLYAITLPTYSQTLFKVLSVDAPLSWCADGDDLYYSNGTDSGRITAGVWYPLGLPTPAATGLGLVAGSLPAGHYQIGVSHSNSVTGEESGISAFSTAELEATAGIRVTLPDATPGADTVTIYLSAANGSVVYRLATVAAGTATYDCLVPATGREGVRRFEEPLPAGRLFMSNNRLCSIAGKTVYVGFPWRHGYHAPAESAIHFAAPVSVAVENQGGTYIVADKTRFFPGGDLGNVEAMVNDVLPYGAVPGTVFQVPDKPLVGWFGANGVVLADTSGQCNALTADNIDVTAPASGVSVVIESRGYQRVVSCGWCVNLENKAAAQYSDWSFTAASGGYGIKDDGIYLLDTTGLVDASIGLGKQDFGSEALKHLPSVYVGMASESKIELTVAYVDEKNIDQEYVYETRDCGIGLQIQRFDPGKGLRATWFDMTLSNSDGADFTLASVSFAPTASTRRI